MGALKFRGGVLPVAASGKIIKTSHGRGDGGVGEIATERRAEVRWAGYC